LQQHLLRGVVKVQPSGEVLLFHRAKVGKTNTSVVFGRGGRYGQTPNGLLIAVHLGMVVVLVLPALDFDNHVLLIWIVDKTHI
jgi:hypothetical protein